MLSSCESGLVNEESPEQALQRDPRIFRAIFNQGIMSYYDDERRHHHHHHHGRPIVEVDIVPPRLPRPVVEIDVGSRYPSYRPECVEVIQPAAVYQPPPPMVEVDVVRPSRPLIEFNIGGRRPREEVVIVEQQRPCW